MRKTTAVASLVAVLCGCTVDRAYFLPGRMGLSPIDMTPAEITPLTDATPSGGPAFLAVSSSGMTKAPAPDGHPIALLHVRFTFQNRTGLDVTFDPGATRAVIALRGSAQPLVLGPSWINPWGQVEENRIRAGASGGFDVYYAAAPPSLLSAAAGFTVDWSYTLGEETVSGNTLFARTTASYYYASSGLPVEYGYYDSYSIYAGPSFYWFWPSAVVPWGGGAPHGSTWIRR